MFSPSFFFDVMLAFAIISDIRYCAVFVIVFNARSVTVILSFYFLFCDFRHQRAQFSRCERVPFCARPLSTSYPTPLYIHLKIHGSPNPFSPFSNTLLNRIINYFRKNWSWDYTPLPTFHTHTHTFRYSWFFRRLDMFKSLYVSGRCS